MLEGREPLAVRGGVQSAIERNDPEFGQFCMERFCGGEVP